MWPLLFFPVSKHVQCLGIVIWYSFENLYIVVVVQGHGKAGEYYSPKVRNVRHKQAFLLEQIRGSCSSCFLCGRALVINSIILRLITKFPIGKFLSISCCNCSSVFFFACEIRHLHFTRAKMIDTPEITFAGVFVTKLPCSESHRSTSSMPLSPLNYVIKRCIKWTFFLHIFWLLWNTLHAI